MLLNELFRAHPSLSLLPTEKVPISCFNESRDVFGLFSLHGLKILNKKSQKERRCVHRGPMVRIRLTCLVRCDCNVHRNTQFY